MTLPDEPEDYCLAMRMSGPDRPPFLCERQAGHAGQHRVSEGEWNYEWHNPRRGVTTIGVAIASIPPRADLLARALASVCAQERPADAVSIAFDHDHAGAATTRNRAWRALDTDAIAMLDDDDEYLPPFLAVMAAALEEHDADMVFPHPQVVGGGDPFPHHYAKPWDRRDPRQTTVACLWRTDALEKIGGFPEPGDDVDSDGNRIGEEYLAVRKLNAMGGKIVHVPERLFLWHHHQRNTSGRGDRW